MSSSTDAGVVWANRSSRWGELNRVVGEWRQHLRSRRELESLNDSLLRDIGVSRSEARFEASKPLWMN